MYNVVLVSGIQHSESVIHINNSLLWLANPKLPILPFPLETTSLFPVSVRLFVCWKLVWLYPILDSTLKWVYLMTFLFWLTSPSMVMSRSTRVAADAIMAYFFTSITWLIFQRLCTTPSWSVYLSRGYISYFLLLAIVNSAAVNTWSRGEASVLSN